MSRKITYYNYSRVGLLTPAQILGANYYDNWRAQDLVLSNGDPITSWTSVGNNAAVMTFGSGQEATYLTNRLNGYPSAQFNGTTDWMQVLGSTGMYNFLHYGGGHIIYVFKSNTGVTSRLLNNINNNGTSTPGFVDLFQDNSGNFRVLTFGVDNTTGTSSYILFRDENPSTLNFNEWNVISKTHDPLNPTASDTLDMTLNWGTSLGSTSSVGTPVNTNAGANLIFGNRAIGGNNQYFDGELVEILIADTIPTPTQLADLETYYNATYGTFPIP